MRVIVVERSGTGLVSARLLVKTGGEADPPDRAGLADLTAGLLTQGTKTRSATQIAEQVEALGGSLDAGARWDAATVSLDVLAVSVGSAMSIFTDVARRPAFAAREVERVRRETLDDLRVSLRNPGTLARLVASRLLFGDRPYGQPLGGTPETVRRIRREDIVRHHRTHFRPDNAVLVIGGDITATAAFALAARLFGDWQRPDPRLLVQKGDGVRQTGGPGGRIVVIDKPDAGQTAVVVTAPGLARTDPDYFKALVANSLLGGGYSSRLNRKIRIEKGLSYGAGSSFDARREVGPFSASTQTKNESGAEVARLIVDELARLATEPIAEEELVPRKSVLTGGFSRSLETTGGFVSQVANLALYGLSLDEINRYIANVQAVGSSDVQRFAGSRLPSGGATVVLVGNAKLFLEDLRKRFPGVALEIIPEALLDLNRADLRRPAKTAATR